jgi:hypothetical protein
MNKSHQNWNGKAKLTPEDEKVLHQIKSFVAFLRSPNGQRLEKPIKQARIDKFVIDLIH